jgi:poly(hydroxyalkanoate) granule-associated protein
MKTEIKNSINNIWLAGLGVASMAQKETVKAYDSLIKEGKTLKKRSNKLVKNYSTKAEKRMSSFRNVADKQINKVEKLFETNINKVENLFETKIEKVLKNLDIPTVKDIKGLSTKVDSLVKEIKSNAKKAA